MPISTDTIILCAGLFVLIVVAMMFGSSGLVPSYGFESSGLKSYPYEGFDQAMKYFNNRETEGFASLMSADYNSAYAKVSTQGIVVDAVPATNSGVPKVVAGFGGVQGDPINEDSGLMSYLAMNPGSNDCKDYGYTKSTGKVCFNPSDVRLLTTRGGNA